MDPVFGNGSSKKLSDGTCLKSNNNHNMGSPRTPQLKRDGTKGSSNYGNDTTRTADHSRLQLPHGEGRKIDNGSIADNAGKYHGRSNTWKVETREEAPVSTRKKKNYHTEQISCNLNDLVLGLKSPIIQLAISKMEEEGSQCNSRSSTSNSSPIPFEFIVDEQKKLTKNYNIAAKEFIPTYSKRSP